MGINNGDSHSGIPNGFNIGYAKAKTLNCSGDMLKNWLCVGGDNSWHSSPVIPSLPIGFPWADPAQLAGQGSTAMYRSIQNQDPDVACGR